MIKLSWRATCPQRRCSKYQGIEREIENPLASGSFPFPSWLCLMILYVSMTSSIRTSLLDLGGWFRALIRVREGIVLDLPAHLSQEPCIAFKCHCKCPQILISLSYLADLTKLFTCE